MGRLRDRVGSRPPLAGPGSGALDRSCLRVLWFTIAVVGGQRLIEHGPYRFVYQPSYTGILISFAGLGVILRHWTSLAVLLVPITAALL